MRALLAVASLLGVGLASAPGPGQAPAVHTQLLASSLARVPAAKLLGQRIMVGMDGTAPSPALLRAVREGRVGSVIVFQANLVSFDQIRSLTGSLQRAARAGGNPPLLIATDQEGGQIKRLPNGPPSLPPPQMAASGNPRVAFRQGLATARHLKARGINWDLAPVLDVPTSGGAFIWQQGRAFSFSAPTVARYGTQFALGLQSAAGLRRAASTSPGSARRLSTPTTSSTSCTPPAVSARTRSSPTAP